jgi:L-asparagine oxygenase
MSPTEKIDAKPAPEAEYSPSQSSDANGEIRVLSLKRIPLPGSVLRLEAEEADLLADLAAGLAELRREGPDRFCEEAALCAALLPRRVRKHVAQFSLYGTREGFLVVRGLPLEPDLPPTPPDNTHHLGETTITAAAQAILNHCAGEMVGYEAEGAGQLFQDMVPSEQAIDTQTSLSSGVELELHTEQAFSLLKPDLISLGALRGARDAATYVLGARDLLAVFDPAERELLREPLWTTGVDQSFRVGRHDFIAGPLRGPFPIIEGSEDDPFIRFDQDLDWGITAQAELLRQKIIELYPQVRTSYTLAPGELLLIDNHRVVHGRSPFRARFAGSDRFIVRSFVVRDLAKSRAARFANGRTIGAQFS